MPESAVGRQVTILGAGIGGLACAIPLARAGFEVTAIERSKERAGEGAGLQISPNGMKVLERLGVSGSAMRHGARAKGVSVRDIRSNREIGRVDFSLCANRLKQPYLLIHREDLIRELESQARREGVRIRLGERVGAVEAHDTHAILELESGARESAGVLIGADGVGSVVRKAINPGMRPLRSRRMALRAVIRKPELADFLEQGTVRLFMGSQKHMVAYPVKGGDFHNIVIMTRRKGVDSGQGGNPGKLEDPGEALDGVSGEIRTLLESCGGFRQWPVHELARGESLKWSKGAAALLGDACHPMLPSMAQGACMALEDAWTLARLLASGSDLQSTFTLYERERRPRVMRIARAAAQNDWIFGSGKAASLLRDSMLRLATRHFPERLARRHDWIYDFDATA